MDLRINEIYNPVKVDIPWLPVLRDVDYNFTFLEHFFPSLEGILVGLSMLNVFDSCQQ